MKNRDGCVFYVANEWEEMSNCKPWQAAGNYYLGMVERVDG